MPAHRIEMILDADMVFLHGEKLIEFDRPMQLLACPSSGNFTIDSRGSRLLQVALETILDD